MSIKKKTFVILSSVLIVLVISLPVLSKFIAIKTPFGEGNGCISVVFDKADVMGADKIVLRDGEKEIIVSDAKLVREIASEFVVANSTGLCGYYQDRWMEIYNGDKLVRNIHWNDHDDLAVVYEKDFKHWVWPSNLGQIQMSEELAGKLNELFNKAQ